MSRQRAEKGGFRAGFWSITRRLYEQSPRPVRQSRTPSRLHPDRRRSLGLYRGRRADDAPKALLADKGYDGDAFRQNLLMHGILPIIPPRSNRKAPEHPDYRRYRDRNRIERMFGKLKQRRRIATRYDKTALSFASFLNLAAARLWPKSFVNAA